MDVPAVILFFLVLGGIITLVWASTQGPGGGKMA